MCIRRSVLLGWWVCGVLWVNCSVGQTKDSAAAAEHLLSKEQWSGTKLLPAGVSLATPLGNKRDANVICYAARVGQGKIEVFFLNTGGEEIRLMEALADSVNNQRKDLELGGVAVWNERMVITLTGWNQLVMVDLPSKKITDRQSLPDFPNPRGAAYDPTGNLWVLSDNSLAEIQFTSDGHFNPVHHRGDFDDPRQLFINRDVTLFVAEQGSKACIKVLSKKLDLIKTITLPPGTHSTSLKAEPNASVWTLLSNDTRLELKAQ